MATQAIRATPSAPAPLGAVRSRTGVRTTRRRTETRARPATSIVIPIYNAAGTLPRCLATLEDQMQPDTQLVLVDDASTDQTPALLAEFVASHPHWNLEVITQPCNRGAGWARRCGFEAATGEYLFWLDADDRLAEGALDRIRRAERDRGRSDTILVFDLIVERPDGTTVAEPGMKSPMVYGEVDAVDALLQSTINWYLWNKVVPRAGVTADMFSTARRGEDLLTLLALTRVHPRFHQVREPLVTYCPSPTSLSQSLDGFEGYLDHENGLVAEVRAALGPRGLTAACRTSLDHCFVLRTVANAAVLGARRASDDGEFHRLARRLIRLTTVRDAATGALRGDRQAAAAIALLAASPRAFRRAAAGRRARHWRPSPTRQAPVSPAAG